MTKTSRLEIRAAKRIEGVIRPPSDKSITHRAFILAALSTEGKSLVRSPLLSEDTINTLNCLKILGAKINKNIDEDIEIDPIQKWVDPNQILYCGNSGTTMRLLAGVIASHPIQAKFLGDDSLNQRPMKRIIDPLRKMGAEIEENFPPLKVKGGKLQALHYISPVSSAQVKSCILLAGLRAEGQTSFEEPYLSRDHTEILLQNLGIHLTKKEGKIFLEGGQGWKGFEHRIPGDFSSAAFWIIAGVLLPGSRLKIKEVNLNPTRTGMLEILKWCGAKITIHELEAWGGESIGNIYVEGGRYLKSFKIEKSMVPRLIDEIPLLAILATQCHGVSEISGIEELKLKESNRIDAICKNLGRMGAKIEYLKNSLFIYGPGSLYGDTIEVVKDHRVAMAFAIAGLLTKNKAITVIENANTISTSYPCFTAHFNQVVYF